jgi:hypothetical protein
MAPPPAKGSVSVTRPASTPEPPTASIPPAPAKSVPTAAPAREPAKSAAQTPLVVVPDAPAPAVSAAPQPASPVSGLRLSATSQRDGRPVAILNDRMVYEGDVIDGITVLHIEENAVEVEVGGEKHVLRF